jgi:Ca2+/Na+ antiporter
MLGFGLGDSSVFIFDINKPIDFAITLTVVCVITLIALFFFKDRPEHLPSLSQAQK